MNLGGTIRDGEKSRPSLIVSHDIICILYMIYIILCLCHIVLYIYIFICAFFRAKEKVYSDFGTDEFLFAFFLLKLPFSRGFIVLEGR